MKIGYDDRNNADPWDDVLILTDPFDKYDDHGDTAQIERTGKTLRTTMIIPAAVWRDH